MTQESKQNVVPNIDATIDAKRIFTLWLKRFRQYTKRKYKRDIAELIRGVEITQNSWTDKEAELQKDLIWGIGT